MTAKKLYQNGYTDLVSVIPPGAELSPLSKVKPESAGKDIVEAFHREEAEKVLDPVTKFLTRHEIDAKSLSKVGQAGETISKTAVSGKFDLVVMGSHGHGTLGNLVMGSVATQVLAHCKVPVLLVR